MILEKKHRLDLFCYEGYTRASFTVCIKNRRHVFTNSHIVENFTDIFASSIKKHLCVNWVYLFMPDHFHFILEGTSLDANLWKAVVLFKQKTGYWFSKNMPEAQWQKDFFDYLHRKDLDLKEHIFYILDNPVRKGIVKNWKDYPHKGSLDLNLHEIIC
jgi:REP element-mobilizing transposase RayT